MKRIIIEYDDTFESPEKAVNRVLEIVKSGQVSTAYVKGYQCPHYCWVTTFKDNVRVLVREKKRLMAADSFLILPPTTE